MNKTTSDLSYLGAVVAFFSGLSWNDLASFFGILLGLATFFINWYYKAQEHELNKQKKGAQDE